MSRGEGSGTAPGLPRQLFTYLVIGGLTVVVDIGLLALLHEFYVVPLGVATTVAYCIAVAVNFLLNRAAMSSSGVRGLTQHALRYASLVVVNYVITLVVVTGAGHLSARWYLVAKLAVVAGSTSWNFLLYRHWVFNPPRSTSAKQDRVLAAVPAYIDQESVGSSGRRGACRECQLGDSGAGRRSSGHDGCSTSSGP